MCAGGARPGAGHGQAVAGEGGGPPAGPRPRPRPAVTLGLGAEADPQLRGLRGRGAAVQHAAHTRLVIASCYSHVIVTLLSGCDAGTWVVTLSRDGLLTSLPPATVCTLMTGAWPAPAPAPAPPSICWPRGSEHGSCGWGGHCRYWRSGQLHAVYCVPPPGTSLTSALEAAPHITSPLLLFTRCKLGPLCR